MSKNLTRGTISTMENDSEKQKEIEEIQRRIEYLINTDQISDSEKLAIANKALKIIELSERKEVV